MIFGLVINYSVFLYKICRYLTMQSGGLLHSCEFLGVLRLWPVFNAKSQLARQTSYFTIFVFVVIC